MAGIKDLPTQLLDMSIRGKGWANLPEELKIKILTFAVSPGPPGFIDVEKFREQCLPILLVSKEHLRLAHEVVYKSNLIKVKGTKYAADISNRQLHDSGTALLSGKEARKLIRQLELAVNLPIDLELPKYVTWSDWLLLRRIARKELDFDNLDYIKITLRLRAVVLGAENIEDLRKELAQVDMRFDVPKVEVHVESFLSMRDGAIDNILSGSYAQPWVRAIVAMIPRFEPLAEEALKEAFGCNV